MNESYECSIGSYNPYTGKVDIEYYGIKQPSEVKILTFNLPRGSSVWTDGRYYLQSGPITAIRIQHGNTVIGIRCRFGAQWSLGFWSNGSSENISEMKFKRSEYMKAVKVGLGETMQFIQFHTN